MNNNLFKSIRAGLLKGWIVYLALCAASVLSVTSAVATVATPVVITGTKHLLVIAVRFPDLEPRFDLPKIERKVAKVSDFLSKNASLGKISLRARLAGWYQMPASLEAYKVSPFNYRVDRNRVRRLLRDALSAARRDADLASFDYIWILVGLVTHPGEGYGMIAYAANPGMLSGVRARRVNIEPVELAGGEVHSGPIVVSAENAHVGHVAHDLLHAIGGVKDGERVVPDLYDFDLQSNPPRGERMTPELFAIHAGPWDLMSQHFIQWRQPPPPPSSFTRLQLGWISADQVTTISPGQTREVTLAPLAKGRGNLVIRIPLDAKRYLLLENRQPVQGDKVLPASGLLVLQVDTEKEEGAGIVRVADANPRVPRLQAAPFVPNTGQRRFYENRAADVAIAPLAMERGGEMRVIVTTPERIRDFLP